MPVSGAFPFVLNTNKRKYLCEQNEDVDDSQFYQTVKQKKVKTETNEANLDLRYLFELPTHNNNNNNHVIINNINNNNNNNDVNSNYDNDHIMVDENTINEMTDNNIQNNETTSTQPFVPTVIKTPDIQEIDFPQNSFWKCHIHDKYFHCRSHYF